MMKYPVGTIFHPPKGFDWSGKVLSNKDGKYKIFWTDGYGIGARYTEEQLQEIIKISRLTWALPYTIGIDEELFTI